MSSQAFNQEYLMQVILAPQISEKATHIAEKHNQVIFRVIKDATRAEIKAAVELMWKNQNIEIENIRVTNVKGKQKRFGKYFGRRPDWKKAYVSLKTDQEINFADIGQGGVK